MGLEDDRGNTQKWRTAHSGSTAKWGHLFTICYGLSWATTAKDRKQWLELLKGFATQAKSFLNFKVGVRVEENVADDNVGARVGNIALGKRFCNTC